MISLCGAFWRHSTKSWPSCIREFRQMNIKIKITGEPSKWYVLRKYKVGAKLNSKLFKYRNRISAIRHGGNK